MGRFVLTTQLLFEGGDAARAIFADLIVLEARHRHDMMGTEYLAIGDQFDELDEGAEAPTYVLETEMDGSHRWVRMS